jgi:hypothetical protein
MYVGKYEVDFHKKLQIMTEEIGDTNVVSPRRSPKEQREIEVPKSELEDMKVQTIPISTLFTIGSGSDISIELTEPLSKVAPEEINRVFLEKCRECSKICDFSGVRKDLAAKNAKIALLAHLVEAFETPAILRTIAPGNIPPFIDMAVDNLARPFPSMIKITAFDYGDQMEDVSWPHLQLVYRSVLSLFKSNVEVTIQNRNFLSVLVSNSCSPDARERQQCRNVLFRVFRKCAASRDQIARLVHNHFLTLVCSRELLDFYVLVVDSMTVPLEPENLRAFHECVLVLHSSHLFLRFCLSLLQVLNHYIRLDATCLPSTFLYIFEHWPWASVRKQVVFLIEVEGLVVSYGTMIDPEIAELIFRQLAKLVNLPHIQIAQSTINLILGDSLGNLIRTNTEAAIRTLLLPLYLAAKGNWNPVVREDAEFAVKMLHKLDEEIFRREVTAMKNAIVEKKANHQIRKTRWEKIFEAAKARDKTIKGNKFSVTL